MRQFRHSYRLVIGTWDLSHLDFSFIVKKTLKPTPNVCDVKVSGLAASTRKALSEKKKYPVRLEAGYEGENGRTLLYLGELRNGVRSGDATEFQTGDAEAQIQSARINVPVGPGTSVADAFQQIAQALGVKEGNLAKAKALVSSKGIANIYGAGSVLSGSAASELSALCNSVGLEWSIQDGALQFLDRGKTGAEQAIKLTPKTGLLGDPSLDHKGILKIETNFIPGLYPGRKIVVESQEISGGFRIEEIEYEGDTAGDTWGCKIEAKRY